MSNGLGKAIAGLGAVMAGYAKGRALYEDREFEKERRARERIKWGEEDRLLASQEADRQAFKEGMRDPTEAQPVQGGFSLSGPRVPQMSMDPEQPTLRATLQQSSVAPTDSVTPDAPAVGLANGDKTPHMLARAKRLLNGYEMAMNEAAKRGDVKAFSQYFNSAHQVRSVVRDQLREDADRAHVMSGGKDFSMYANIFNDMVDDGTTANVVAQDDGSYLLTGTGRDGKPFEHKVANAQEMRSLINQMFDPKAMRQLEAQKALKLWEAALQRDKEIAVEQAKAGLKQPEVVKRSMGEGKPEQIGLMRDGKIQWQDSPGLSDAAPLDRKTTDAMRTTIMGLYKVSDIESMSPDVRKKVGNALSLGSMLLQSNQGTEAGKRLDINTAAKIASDIADGIHKETRWRDSQGNEWRGVEVNGVKYLLDPTPIKIGKQATGTSSAPTREVVGKIKNPAGQPSAFAGKAEPPRAGKDANVPASAVWSKTHGAWVEVVNGKTRLYYPEEG